MAFCGTDCKLRAYSLNYIDGFQYSLIVPKNQHPPLPTVRGSQQRKGLQKYPPHKSIEVIALRNKVIQATETGDGRYTAEIRLRVPIEFSRSEIEGLIGNTDDWAGWCDSPRHCLSELGLLIEQAIASVGGAK